MVENPREEMVGWLEEGCGSNFAPKFGCGFVKFVVFKKWGSIGKSL